MAVTAAPLEIAPSAQLRSPAVIVQAGDGLVDSKVTPDGAASVSTTLAACDGPAFCTTSCQVAVPPATGVPESSVLTTDTSAAAPTVPVAVAAEVSGVVLALSEVTVPVLVIVLPGVAVAGTATSGSRCAGRPRPPPANCTAPGRRAGRSRRPTLRR